MDKPKKPELGTQEELVGAFTHDAKNSLTSIASNISFAREVVGDNAGELRDALADAAESASRLVRQIDDLVVLTRAQSGLTIAQRDVDLAPLIDGVVRHGERRAQAFNVTLRAVPSPGIRVSGDPELLARALAEALDYAVRSSGEKATVEIGAGPDGDGVAVWVRHDGRPLDSHPKIAAWKAGSRRPIEIGFGLAVAWVITEAHGGTLLLHATSERSAEIRMRLPRAR